jgi:Beta-galactosidase
MTITKDSFKIFSLLSPDKDPTSEIPGLRNPLVDGLSWRFRWATVEPREGQYNWELIDRAIEGTTKAGKKVMLRVVAGINAPEWVYQSGAKPFDFCSTDLVHPGNHPRDLQMPIPWDSVYLTKWEKFIEVFGSRYNGRPELYSIQMTGGGYIGEMNLPKALGKWQQVGYTDEKLIAAWKRIVDAYQKAFPVTPTNLDINEPLGKSSDVLAPVVSYVLATYPRKVYLQHNGLKAEFPRDQRVRKILREAADKTTVGYQMVGGKGFLEGQTGDRLTAFRNALEDRASYIEVYASDVKDQAHSRALQSLRGPSGSR